MEQEPSKQFKTIGNLMPDIVKNASNLAMTSPSLPTVSETMPSPTPKNTQIGTQLSTLGSVTLRDLAVAATEGQAGVFNEKSLRILLESHFQSRLVIKTKTSFGTEEAPDFRVTGFQVKLTTSTSDDDRVIKLLEAMNRPARAEFVTGKLARLRVAMARRGESDKDVALLMDTMVDICREYPADVVADSVAEWMRTETFFPKPKDIIDLMDERVMLRRSVLAALQGENTKQLGAPVVHKDWKELHKDQWDMHMWLAFVADAENMHKLALQNPEFMDAEGWIAEIAKRKAQIPAAIQDQIAEFNGAAGVSAPTE